MLLIIAAKDSTDRIELDVEFTWQEEGLYCMRFKDGTIRKYPVCHIWYVEIKGRAQPRRK